VAVTKPSGQVDAVGVTNAAAAAKLKGVLEAEIPTVVVLTARFEGLAKLGGVLATTSGASDMKASCLPLVAAAASKTISDVTADAASSSNVVGAVQ
jgi:hypothetical protein